MPTITAAPGVDIHVEVAGSGPRLLYIPGTGGDLRSRPSIFDSPLAEQFELATYDQRGLGRSSVPDGPYSMAGYADDAVAVAAGLGWDGTLVIGLSFGGMVAQELAIRYPSLVRRLVLCCTSSGGAGGSSYPLHELADLDDDERVTRTIELMDQRYDAAWRTANPKEWDGLVGRARDYLQLEGEDGVPDPRPREGPALQLAARSTHDAWERLGQIACPTLVCGGRYDGIAPAENSARLARAIPHCRLELFEGGHAFVLQDPHAFPTIVEFLRASGS